MLLRPQTSAIAGIPYLEHYPEPGGVGHRILLHPLPFRIGRSKSAHWVIGTARVSKEHAEIVQVEDEFYVRDLGSTNGTFVNGKPVGDARQGRECRLTNGDILHIAHVEFMFSCETAGPHNAPTDGDQILVTDPVTSKLPASLIRNREQLRELVDQRWVTTLFQPIVTIPHQQLLGYEALGRGCHPHLSPSPVELFDLASKCRLASRLSEIFRSAAAEQVRHLPRHLYLFLNTHPSELWEPGLLEELQKLRALLTDHFLVLEVHEHAVTDPTDLRRLKEQLRALDIEMAFDDFGVGQARLLELAETPPDFIKLDRSLISGLSRSAARHDMVQSLCRLSLDLGVRIVAEGIETAEEADICQSLGCHYGQGYFFGRPQPATVLGKH